MTYLVQAQPKERQAAEVLVGQDHRLPVVAEPCNGKIAARKGTDFWANLVGTCA